MLHKDDKNRCFGANSSLMSVISPPATSPCHSSAGYSTYQAVSEHKKMYNRKKRVWEKKGVLHTGYY